LPKSEKPDIEENNICPECNSAHIIKDYCRAELVCDDCGLVIEEELFDYGPDWRAFDNEQREKRAHTGAPTTYMIPDKGLSTTISWTNKDSQGRSIPNKNRAQIYRLRKWQKRTRPSNTTHRNIAVALSSLDRLTSRMGLPRSVRENAAMIYRKAASKNIVRGRSIDGVAAAALYAACRQCQVPRTLDEVSDAANIPRKEIGRNYRYMVRELGLKLMPPTPEDYISRFCSELKLSPTVQAKTLEMLQEFADLELTTGRGPTGVAAASLYITSVLCGERRTQREVADVAGVTEVTIRNRYKELAEKLNIDIAL
jgi:transcription initiation factor TFIIB